MIIKRLELTEIQKGIYFDCQFDNQISYNISATILLEGLQEKYFENAFKLLIGEQEALRSSLETVNDFPVFAVHDQIDFKLTVQDLSGNLGEQKELLEIIFEEETGRAFDLNKAPLFRVKLIKLAYDKHLFLICIHHIISDGVSLENFKKKLLDYYHKLANKKSIILKQDTGFTDFIEKENARLIKGEYKRHKEFWMKKMQGAEPVAIQADYSVKQKDTGIGREKRFEIPADLMKDACNLAMEHEVTAFMLFLASFGVLMNRYTRNEDIVLSSPFTYRPSFDYEETIGCFVSMLPMRMNIEGNKQFSAILKQVSKELIDVYRNIGYPNNLIMRDSLLVPMPGSPSIFDISFVCDVYEETGDYDIKAEIVDQDIVTFPGTMMVILNRTPKKDLIKIQYKPGIFSDETIELLGCRFLELLKAVIANADIKIEDIELMLEDEKNRILNDFNSSSFFPYRPQTIVDIFNSKVLEHPGRKALIEGERIETYASVNIKANQLAGKILKKKKSANEAVGVQIDRSADLVITLLAILKAGCAYMPVEASYPAARKEFIFKDANISLLITSRNLPFEEEWGVDVIYIDDPDTYTGDSNNPPEEQDPFSLAYIMYTSGSTGKPKGVMIENHSVVNTLLDLERRFPLGEHDVFLLKTPYTFDVSVTELFGWFMGEGCLLILEPGGEKNPQLILDEIQRHHVTHINFVPTMFRLFLELFDAEADILKLNSLKWIFVGGEAVTPDILQRFNSLKTNISLENVYGPTECTIWASHYQLKCYTDKANIPIGRPLNEIRWYVVGDSNKLQPVCIPGELCLSGAGLARGYLNRDELTKEKFAANPFYREGIDPCYYRKMYRTGDLARWLPDGTIEFLGRMDFQVKVRGVRMELGEIENILAEYKGIVHAVVVVKKEPGKPETLCAYYLSENEIPAAKLKDHLSNALPAYMIPSFFVHKKELPLNTSGKINRNALIADLDYLQKTSSEYLAPSTELEHMIASVWEEVLAVPRVGLDDNFFEAGGHSLSLIQVHHRLKKVLDRDFPVTLLFKAPTVRLLAEHFTKDEEKVLANREIFFKRKGKDVYVSRDIAVIGISVRVPGAQNIRSFWGNLKEGKESIYFYSDGELEKLGVSPDTLSSPNYIKAKGRVDGIDYFDPCFFEYTPGEVRMMSPQLRLLYQGTWEALEDAGYFPGSDTSRIGIFLGGSDDFEWYKKVLFGESGFSNKYQAFTLSTNHFLATRIAYKLDIKGPVFSALTGCSTTLVTPHLSCQSLIMGECDLAVAGGITVELPNEGGYFYEEGMMFSPDGHCRPFDAKARGTVFSNGFGLVVLKRLEEAIKDGDNIYAVIKGSAVNNDGRQKVGFVAPSVEGQAEVVQEAYRVAGIDPETVSYVEAHGTGTAMGDPIEVESLTKAFATDKKQFCILGSVKGNIGHADTAAGAVGLAKVALCLKHKYIPGTVNFEEPNPGIDFKNTPFLVNAYGAKWENKNIQGGLLRAGINSFGVGGTNAHMVLEEPPDIEESSPSEKVNLLNFSAKSLNALTETSRSVLEYLLENPEVNLSDAAWTLKIGRKAFPFRKCLAVGEDFYKEPEKAIKRLNDAIVNEAKPGKRNVYLMFPGQGSQYQGMGRELYYSGDKSEVSGIFKSYIDEIFGLLNEGERHEFMQLLYGDKEPQKINQTQYTQFVLFATSYALAKTVIKLGIQPVGMIGHSIGEVTAAAVAGVFELKDAVEIVRFRGQAMQRQEPGTMLAVMAPAHVVEKELEQDVWLALENTTNSCVVGGSESAIARFEEKLKRLGLNSTRVKTSHAFHTPMMEKAAREFEKKLSEYKLKDPQIPIVSNISGMWIREGEMTDPKYWSKHILKPVNFAKSLEEILKTGEAVFIEVGAGHTLSAFARQHDSKKEGQEFINLIRHPREAEDDVEYINKKIGQLWCTGVEIDWHALKGDSVRRRVSLPTYVFDKVHFPIDVKLDLQQPAASAQLPEAQEYGFTLAARPAAFDSQSDLENAVIEAYKAVFGFDTVGADQDFFSLGGDSLKAVSLASVIKNILGVKVEVTDLFKYSSPGALAAYLKENAAVSHNPMMIKPAAKKDFYPLSSAQSRMYALYLLDKSNVAYNLPSATIIKGRLDRKRLEKALEKLILRHESLRTSFEIREDRPVQIIHPNAEAKIAYSEKAVLSNEEINQLIYAFIKPFDLERAPLFRAELVKTEEDRYLLLFDVHHIIADGTSVEIITRDFNELYFSELTPPEIQYRDFAVWQNDFLKSEEIKEQRDFWLSRLGDDLPVLELPTDFERPPVKDFEGSRIYFSIDRELSERVIALAHEAGATIFMTMLAAWNVLLARYSGQEDIIIGTPVAGRTQEEIEETVGMFVNMLAMRNRPENKKRFIDFLNEVKENSLKAFQYQNYQFDELVERLSLKRELNRNALFDVCFDYQNMEFYDLEIEDIRFTPYQFETRTAAYDLVLTCQENKKEQAFEGFLEYATGLFKKETVERMLDHFRTVLSVITREKEVLIENIDLFSKEERQRILEDFNDTALPADDYLLIQNMFEQNVKSFPDKIALIVSGGKALTYRELNEKANALAQRLIELGVGEDSLVGVMPLRDENLFVSLLGVLKAGGAYVPIDPGFPKERISYMLSECNAGVLICPEEYHESVGFEGTMIDCSSFEGSDDEKRNPPQRGSKNSLACVIFTSGSTGKPKGVMINQGSIVNFIHDIKNRAIFQSEDDRVICVTTVSFDIFGFESIVPLCTGHSVYLADENEQLDPALANQKIIENKVTHILSTVSRIKAFVENPDFGQALKQLKCILSGGENYPVQLLRDLQKRSQARLYNMYGPTETTIWSTTKELTDSGTVNIGKPIANTRAYIMNGAGKLQPVGVFGELCLAGRGLARGYLNNPEETENKFVRSSDISGVLYRTGDRARFLDNGEIELMGRLDSQIKIRGYRIELDEIEKVALGHESVRQAVAAAIDDRKGNKKIALYYSIKRENADSEKDDPWLKSWLKDRLPHYMIPSYFMLLDEMPVLPNGKINKKALPLPGEHSGAEEAQVLLPSSGLEKALLEIWKEVLGIDRISVRDNFFDAGGNSLGLILINNRLNTLIGRSVPLVQLFKHPTVESLARSLDVPKTKIKEEITSKDDTINDTAGSLESADIAVIGMACKFPGADNIELFWENIVSGAESIVQFDDEELVKAGVNPKELSNPNYVKAKGFLDGVEFFDSDFFDYPYQEANMMDPQIRVLHQCVWEALESAGYNPSSYEGRIGLFAGSGSNMPWMTRFLGHQHDILNAFEAMTLNEKDFLTTRVSYKLNLKGPSFNVQTACSTSLVAIHQAAQSLLRGESHMAIAGGISISYPRKEGYLWHEGMIFSRDGHCRPFADDASGTVAGNGCGVVLLKPLSTALRDGDNIYAVIKGSAINNDGIEKIGYTAPSVAGQSYVIETALKNAGVSPEEISYLEAHGTGTKLGDPIEVEALKQAWNTDKKGYCAIGSVKANIGHLDAAAGVAGFMKAVLTLYHRTIPPLIHFKNPNPGIDFANSPFYVNTEARYILDNEKTLRAGVSSFGIGGTNVHVILEQPPGEKESSRPEEVNLLVFSARSQTALINTCKAVLTCIQDTPGLNLSDAAWTLQEGRKPFEYRKALVVNGCLENLGQSGMQAFIQREEHKIQAVRRPVIFVFPGEESQYRGIGGELYGSAHQSRLSEIFKRYMDEVLSFFLKEESEYVIQVLYGNPLQADGSEYGQLAMFATGYSLAKALIEVGAVPDGVMGQGTGEISAMAVAGVLELRDAVEIVKACGELMREQEPGALAAEMAGSRMGEKEKAAFAYEENLKRYKLNEPEIPLIASTAEDNTLFIEMGADSSMAAFVKQSQALCPGQGFISLLRPAGEKGNALVYINSMLGRIWCEGIGIDWSALKGDSVRKRIPLPTYVFDRKYHENDIIPEPSGFGQKDEGTESAFKEQLDKGKSLEPGNRETVTEKLSAVWHEILGCGEVRPEDDFFELGGHSLKAISLAAQIQKVFDVEMPLTEIFSHSVFSRMADWLLSGVNQAAFHKIRQVEKKSCYEVSSAQKRLYAVNEMIGSSVPYNLASVYLVEGIVDRDKFKKVIDELVQRHESFRTRFTMTGGEIVQIIEEDVGPVVEFGTSTEAEIEAEIESCIRPFDLSKAPLLRIKLISMSEEKHVLFIDMHHIISDQSSIAILLKEFTALYSGNTLPPLTVQYKDFAAWQNELFRSGEIERQLEYWKNEFKGEIPVLNMLTDFKRPRIQSFGGNCVKFEFGEELSGQIDRLAGEYGLTSYMVLISALKLVLWKYTGQNDMVVGTGIAGRRHADLDSIVGMFVNTLAVRSQIDETLTVAEYLQYIKGKMVKAYENQDCQFEMLVESLRIEKDMARNPLFDVVINYINMGTEELTMEGLSVKPRQVDRIDSKFDMTWTIQKKDDGYYADIEYNTALFKRETMKSLGDRLLNMVSVITEEPERKLAELSILTPHEKEWLLYGMNQTATDFPGNKTIVQLFEEQVKQYGHNTALIWEDEEISYSELNQRANNLSELLAGHNVKQGDKVAILLDQSPLRIISILGILKCGCVYVPIDPEYPDKRIGFMIEDSGSCLLLTHSRFTSRIGKSIPLVLLDIEPDLPGTGREAAVSSKYQPKNTESEDIAYIMYTSGSTGVPKGTLISHRNVIRVVRETNYLTILPTDRLLQLSNYAFDGSVFDIFGALLNGACLVMVSKEDAIEIPQLSRFIEQKGITVFFITTALFNMLVDWDIKALKSVRKILFGGEATSVAHARKALEFLGSGRIVNVYGPTETTVFAAYYPIDKIEDNAQVIPIGYPVSNTTLYILDKQGQPVPPNVPGELYIGGAGVGKGYLNRENLTRQRFLEHPFESTGRVYRTGDLVWRLPTGEIGFIGRLDFQIKIRGFRVELGEIENHIKNMPEIKEVVVISQKDKTGSLYIAAYYTAGRKADGAAYGIEPAQIREFLSDKIPDYMIPSRMKRMESLPLNLNGKINRSALPVIEEAKDGLSGYAAPRTEAERIILEKMQDVLDNAGIGIKDDFFKFGGQSIKAIALVQSLSKAGIKLRVNEIFQHPTVEELAALPELKHLHRKDAGLKPDAREEEISLCSVVLNEQQVSGLAEHVGNTCDMISRMVLSANKISQFPLSPVQRAHSAFGSNISGFTASLKGGLDEQEVRRLIMKIIRDNQLLHCVIEEDGIPLWNECDLSLLTSLLIKSIPYLDLREYNGQTKELIIEKLCSSILLSPYRKGYLPWRLCCLRCNQDTHFVIWGFDHTAFDGMSAEVIRHQIESGASLILNEGEDFNTRLENEGSCGKYQDYVSLLAKGPEGISEKEIIELFSLNHWSEKNLALMESLDKIPDRDGREIEIRIPLKGTEIQDSWRLAFDLTVRLLSEYTGVSEIPLALVHYGRSYGDKDYYNCVGEFLDIIPLLTGEKEDESRIPELLKQCRLNSVNFLSLLFDESLSAKFVKIADLLAPSYKAAGQLKRLALFNFQGFVSKEEKNAFRSSAEDEESRGIAKLLITVNYDEENMYIGIESPEGMNTGFMGKAIQSYLGEYTNIAVSYRSEEVKHVQKSDSAR